jgi:signal transduction histidine kinase
MLKPASPKFVDLCQTQISLLKNGLGAALGVVYLTEEPEAESETRLIPVVADPEAAASWDAQQVVAKLADALWLSTPAPNLRSDGQPLALPASDLAAEDSSLWSNTDLTGTYREQLHGRQIIVPLIHDGVMMGLLVTARPDRAWDEGEQFQIERIAQTIAIACILDQRSQWLEHELRQQRLLQAQQQDIFHDLLHQFRNPLTALRTFGKLLLKRFTADDRNRDMVEGIIRESDRLQELLKQFDIAVGWGDAQLLPSDMADTGEPTTWSTAIDLSSNGAISDSEPTPRLLSGGGLLTGASLDMAPHPITHVLEPLVMSATAIAQEKKIDLKTFIPSDLPPVLIDLNALREVLDNLIDNALKYTPEEGTIEIWAGIRQQQRQCIVIADTGPGIPPQDLAHIFERHYRGVQQEGDIPGSGLGLAIARSLIQQMQGEIQVFSPARTSELIAHLSDDWGTKDYPGTAFVVWLQEA